MRGFIVLLLTPPPILLVGRKAKFSFKGAVSSNSELVTVNVFTLFSMFDIEQIYCILFVKDLYYYPFFLIEIKIKKKITGVYSMDIKNIPVSIYAQYLLYKCLPFCLKEHKCLFFRYVGRICP
jgi:hypothetical protein